MTKRDKQIIILKLTMVHAFNRDHDGAAFFCLKRLNAIEEGIDFWTKQPLPLKDFQHDRPH